MNTKSFSSVFNTYIFTLLIYLYSLKKGLNKRDLTKKGKHITQIRPNLTNNSKYNKTYKFNLEWEFLDIVLQSTLLLKQCDMSFLKQA